MSLIFCDGFDDNLPKWDGIAIPKTTGRNGQGGNITPGTYTKSFGSDAHQTIILGGAFKIDSPPYGVWNYIRLLGSDGSEHFRLSDQNNSYGRDFIFYVNGTARHTYSTMPYAMWTYLEIKYTVADSGGSCTVRANGTQLFTYSGDTKAGTGTDTINSLQLSCGGGANGDPWQVDDLYVCNGAGSINNDFLGDTAIETVYPNGNGSENDFLGSDGNSVDNYLLVDEPGSPNTTDYTGGANVGDRDLYTMANLARTSGNVRGIVASAYLQNSDSGPRGAGIIIKSGATVSPATDLPLGTSWQSVSKIFENDPNTGLPWTVSGINSLEAGVEVTS